MTEPDLVIVDVGALLAASKRKSYRDSVLSYTQVLVRFLQDQGLASRQMLEAEELPDAAFKIMKSDLTNLGYELMKHGLDKWTRWIERGNQIDDVSVLELELKNIRSRGLDR